MYVYTAVPISEASSTLRNGGSSVSSTYAIAHYKGYSCIGTVAVSGTYGTMTHYYYDFGDISSWNNQRHIYTGTMKFDFDISDTPFLATLRGSDGGIYEPAFSHISIYNTKISDQSYSKITEVDEQDLIFVPEDIPERASNSNPVGSQSGFPSGNDLDDSMDGNTWRWNALPDSSYGFSNPYSKNNWDGGIVPTPRNQPLITTNKDGSPSWNADTQTESMKDGAFMLPIGTVSPSVIQNWRTLKYEEAILHVMWDWCLISNKYRTARYEIYKAQPSSLYIYNRAIRYEISMEMLITTEYLIDVYRQVDEVEKPIEYYDDLIYRSGVGGAIRGEVELPQSLIASILFWLIVFIVLIGVIMILNQYMKSRGRQTKIIMESHQPKN